MNTTLALTKVGVADPIRRNPELDRAVMLATRYFEDLLVKHEIYEAERELNWSLDTEATAITLQIVESDKFGHRQVSRSTKVMVFLDSNRREGFILSLLSDLLRQHWSDARRIREREWRLLESEETPHAISS